MFDLHDLLDAFTGFAVAAFLLFLGFVVYSAVSWSVTHKNISLELERKCFVDGGIHKYFPDHQIVCRNATTNQVMFDKSYIVKRDQ